MDPAHFQQAASAMAAMSPEQRAQMGQMFSNMDPSMFANMAKSMGMPQVSEEQIKEAQQKMSTGELNMDDASRAAQAMPQQALYMTNGAKALKEQGNTLFRQQKYTEAAELYTKAIANLSSVVPIGAVTVEHAVVLKACRLNTARCHLETNQFSAAEELCTAVLVDNPRDLKALFRRGLARENLKKISDSVRDLTLALEDPRADGAVKDALERVQNLLEKTNAASGKDSSPVDVDTDESSTFSTASTADSSPATKDTEANKPIEGASDHTNTPSSSSNASTGSSSNASTGRSDNASTGRSDNASKDKSWQSRAEGSANSGNASGTGTASDAARARLEASQRQMREQLAQNPSMLDNAQEQIARMDPKMLQSMLKMQGLDIPDEQIKGMQAASAAMPKDAFRDQMERSVNTPLPDTLPQSAVGYTSSSAGGGASGDSGGSATSSGSAVAASRSAFPGMPNGQMPDANQMKMAAEMMKNMKPEQMESMMKMASQMAPMMGGMRAGGGMPKPEDMAKLTDELKNNPEMMQNMTNMVKDLDPDVLANMSKQAGMEISPEQAEKMTAQMKNLTPEQMAKLMTWTTRLQTVLAWMKWLWNVLFGSQLKAAGTILFLALLLANWLGYV